MKKTLLIFLLHIITISVYSQYCTSAGPSSSADSDLGAITLNGNTTNINIAASCPGTKYVEDLTSTQSADLSAGNTYTLSVEFTTCDMAYLPTGAGTVWIDYDNNQTFTPNEIVGTWLGTVPETKIFTFTVPDYICNTSTRMRIMHQENTTLPLKPCQPFIWGAVIDVKIILSGGTCTPPILGCTDPNASNFLGDAEVDDGSCIYGNKQDCEGSTIICNDYPNEDYYPGDGNVNDEIPSSSCLGAGEKNSVWYKFRAYETGEFGFTLTPNTIGQDYDWSVFDITLNGCEGIPLGTSPELSCNFSPNQMGCDGSTGPNGVLTGPCAAQNEPLLNVDSGHVYAVVVSQYEDDLQDGFLLSIPEDTNQVVGKNSLTIKDYYVACEGDSIELNIIKYEGPNLGGLEYSWYIEDTSWVSTKEKPYTFPLDSAIKIIASVRNRDCYVYDTTFINVGHPKANFGWSFEDNGFPVEVFFTDSSKNAEELTWVFDTVANKVLLPGNDPSQYFEENGNYNITQIAKDSLGCFDTFNIVLPIPLIVPNIFTPNGDGINDLFLIKGIKKNSDLRVYNRWGKILFSMEGSYDGTWDGGNLPDGIYYYEIQEPGTKGEKYKNWLQISR